MRCDNHLKHFSIVFHDKECYQQGEAIRGSIVIELAPKQCLAKLRVDIHGAAKVFWNSSHLVNHYTPHSYARSEDAVRAVVYFDAGKSVFESRRASCPSGPRDPRLLLPVTPGVQEEYPFIFLLPEGRYPASWHGLYGAVQYWVEAVAEISGAANQISEEHTSRIVKIAPLPVPLVQNPSPTHKKFRVINVACGKSSVSCGIQLEKSSYVPGDFLTVICDISNSSPWHIFPRASLIRLESYSGKDGCVKEVKDELVFTAGEAIKPYSDVRWSLPVWTIPHNAPVSLLDCALIKNCYFILVRLQIRRFLPQYCEVRHSIILAPPLRASSASLKAGAAQETNRRESVHSLHANESRLTLPLETLRRSSAEAHVSFTECSTINAKSSKVMETQLDAAEEEPETAPKRRS